MCGHRMDSEAATITDQGVVGSAGTRNTGMQMPALENCPVLKRDEATATADCTNDPVPVRPGDPQRHAA